ncbi:MAG: peptidoglycan DD-metalloendopeptidase family protein [Candidatus Eisenbacteria bacterium]|nr:peptidoglycan DD-metalloendopeptidase family protein [Candidatus Eisenbacteria bacterium]
MQRPTLTPAAARPSALLAHFNRLPETARFYSVLSALVVVLWVASGLTVHQVTEGARPILNPRSPILTELSPWGRVLEEGGESYLDSGFDIIGVVTPLPEETASHDYIASPGEDLETVASAHGIDLDLLASANNVSYARTPRRETQVRLPLMYSRERHWDRSLEFLYPLARSGPIGGNGKANQGPPKIARHAVARGECLWTIARKYHVRMETIVAMNDLPSARYLRPGQILEIPDTDGTYITIKKNDTVDGVCKKYDIEITDLVNANPGVDVHALQIGERLFVPGTQALTELFRFGWPVHGRISGRYGHRIHPVYHRRMMHTGLDIAAGYGSPIRAALTGRVVFVGWKGGYGRTVIVEHPNGYETLYGHCSKILVSRGETVKRGDIIARVGSTGISTGPHVHFEVREHGKRINPERMLY